jgi:hypothetical protein
MGLETSSRFGLYISSSVGRITFSPRVSTRDSGANDSIVFFLVPLLP